MVDPHNSNDPTKEVTISNWVEMKRRMYSNFRHSRIYTCRSFYITNINLKSGQGSVKIYPQQNEISKRQLGNQFFPSSHKVSTQKKPDLIRTKNRS